MMEPIQTISQNEIVITFIAAILSSGILNVIITNIMYKYRLKKEQKIGHENMIGEKINEALLNARELELECRTLEIYKPEEVMGQKNFSSFDGYGVFLTISNNADDFLKYVDRIGEIRRTYEKYLGFKESAFLWYIERYCQDYIHIIGKYKVGFKDASTIFITDFQRWQRKFERLLVKRINKPKHKLYDKNRKGWERAKTKVIKDLWNKSLLFKFKNDENVPEVLMIKALIIDRDEEKVNRILDEAIEYDKKHKILTYIRKIKNKI